MKRSPSVGQSDMKCKKTTSASITEVVRESQDPGASATLLHLWQERLTLSRCQYPQTGVTLSTVQCV